MNGLNLFKSCPVYACGPRTNTEHYARRDPLSLFLPPDIILQSPVFLGPEILAIESLASKERKQNTIGMGYPGEGDVVARDGRGMKS
ncbi:hypothetical protein ACLOJK_021592 [Asimina triloba]